MDGFKEFGGVHSSDLVKLDDNRFYYAAKKASPSETSGIMLEYSLRNISYRSGNVVKTIPISEITSNQVFLFRDDKVEYISKPDDLKNMKDGYYYELKNDIDLAGIEWHGSKFSGVLNGNGYSIKNMSFVGTMPSTEKYIGLFSYGNGIISDLNIEGATIIVDVPNEEVYNKAIYCGSFIGYCTDRSVIIRRCAVDKYSVISIRTAQSNVHVGGFVGYGECSIINSINNGAVCGNNNVGGFIGSGNSSIINSTNNGTVSGNNNIGGFVGTGDSVIIDCTNNGAVSGNYNVVGGFVGLGNSRIINSTNNGAVSGNYNVDGFVGAGDSIIIDCTNNGAISSKD